MKVFEAIDVDSSGTVSAKDLQIVLSGFGLELTDTDAKSLIAEADTDGTVRLHDESVEGMLAEPQRPHLALLTPSNLTWSCPPT